MLQLHGLQLLLAWRLKMAMLYMSGVAGMQTPCRRPAWPCQEWLLLACNHCPLSGADCSMYRRACP
jgi:hypothetical protein